MTKERGTFPRLEFENWMSPAQPSGRRRTNGDRKCAPADVNMPSLFVRVHYDLQGLSLPRVKGRIPPVRRKYCQRNVRLIMVKERQLTGSHIFIYAHVYHNVV